MRYISDEVIKTIKDRLDPVSEPDELYDIINDLLSLRNQAVISTVEDWLLNNYPTKEETLDTINTPKFWRQYCSNCQFRNKDKQTVTYDDTDLCTKANAGELPQIRHEGCITHKTDFSPINEVKYA